MLDIFYDFSFLALIGDSAFSLYITFKPNLNKSIIIIIILIIIIIIIIIIIVIII